MKRIAYLKLCQFCCVAIWPGYWHHVHRDWRPHDNEILEQILEQNAKTGLKIESRYKVKTKEGEHDNIILSSDLGTHHQLLRHGAIIFGFSSCKIFEYVNIIQCFRCMRFGHFARDSKHAPRCQLCTQNHEKKECTQEFIISKCVNCAQANRRNGTIYSTRHRSTDERCPVRVQRINGLKTYLISKTDDHRKIIG